MKERIDVSPEMLTFVGCGAIEDTAWPMEPVMLRFPDPGGRGVVEIVRRPTASAALTTTLVFVVSTEACERLFAAVTLQDGRWHLPSELNRLALSIVSGSSDPAGTAVRLARSIELLCGVFGGLERGELVPAATGGTLTKADALRMVEARRVIDDRWREKLTLAEVARACGMNRAKLTRGFREQFQCTVGDLIADRRLKGAHEMLLATDLPVASVGHACGYLSNASFTRAFTRRFGVPPTHVRRQGVTA